MTEALEPTTAKDDRDEFGRPKAPLAWGQLLAVTAYWIPITALQLALFVSVVPQFVHNVLGADHELAGAAVGLLNTLGVIVAIVVQPTIGGISDNTRSRMGRRKPYILWGSIGDIVFMMLACWAFVNESYWAFAGTIVLLQLSSNVAQGPFQGYVPDLVPKRQVGTASGLLGAAQMIGNLGGPAIAIVFLGLGFPLGLFITIAVIELVAMIVTLRYVPDSPGPETTLPLLERAKAAWGTDILKQHDFVWLLVSRLFVLIGLTSLAGSALFYLINSLGMADTEAQAANLPILIVVGAAALLSAIPGGRLSSRFGRKPVIYGGIACGIVGAVLLVVAPAYWMVLVAAVPVGICSGVFLAVDWALMTDIIPKAESGRYMGISNVVTAGSGSVGTLLGGVLAFVMIGVAELGPDLAYRGVFGLMALELAIGAWTLTHVNEPRHNRVVAAADPSPA
jgi:MFS family permease